MLYLSSIANQHSEAVKLGWDEGKVPYRRCVIAVSEPSMHCTSGIGQLIIELDHRCQSKDVRTGIYDSACVCSGLQGPEGCLRTLDPWPRVVTSCENCALTCKAHLLPRS